MIEELERLKTEREVLKEYARVKLQSGDYVSVIAACVDLKAVSTVIDVLERAFPALQEELHGADTIAYDTKDFLKHTS